MEVSVILMIVNSVASVKCDSVLGIHKVLRSVVPHPETLLLVLMYIYV